MAYAFFNKYQRPLLIALTLFVLVTFSVTGMMTSTFQEWLRPAVPFPTITMPDGRVVRLTQEDYTVARAVLRSSDIPGVPALVPLFDQAGSAGQEVNRTDALAMLRRAAIEHGLDVSDQDVQDAKKLAFETLSNDGFTPRRAAEALFGPGASENEYDRVVREAMRISVLVRLKALDSDLSSAALMDHIRKQKKETSYTYVAFPAKPIEEELAKTPPDDAALLAWIEKLPAHEQQAYKDSNHAALSILGLRLAEFDPNDWTVELQDFKLDETVIEARYTRDRDAHYKKTPESKPGSMPGGDGSQPASRSSETNPASREVPRQGGDEKKNDEEEKDENGNVQDSKPASSPAATGQGGIDPQGAGDVATTRPASGPAPFTVQTFDEATYIPLADVRDEIEKRLKVEAVLGVLLTKAQARAKEEGEKFDFVKWAEDLRKEKQDPKALVVLQMNEPKSAEELKTLDRLGTWQSSFQVGYLQNEGDFASVAQPTSEGALIFRAGKIVKEPFRPIDRIRSDATADRVKKEAMAQAKKASEDFIAALRERAKAKVPDAVATIEKDKETQAVERLAKWKEKQERTLQDIEKILARGIARATAEYTPVKERIQKELASGDQEKKIRDQVATEFETKIHEAVAPHLGEVFDEVAKEKGLTASPIEPFLPDVTKEPDFKTRYPDPVARFLIENMSSTLAAVKKGGVSGSLEDMTNRAHAIARVNDRKLPPESAITRTEFRQMRRSFEDAVMRGTLTQGFSFEALKVRYKFTPAKNDNAQ